MNFLQGLRLFFGMMLMFGIFYQFQGGEKGPAVRAFEFTLIGVGAVGSLVMLALGLGKPTEGSGGRLKCEECGTPAPAVRKPKNRRQTLWGGWTCKNCGTELDRRGRKVEEEEDE
jgi:hypothetical protein